MTRAQSREDLQDERRSRLRGPVRRALVWGILAAALALQSVVSVHPIGHALADSARPCALCAAAHIAPIPQSYPETPAAALVSVDRPQTSFPLYVAALVPTQSARAPPFAG